MFALRLLTALLLLCLVAPARAGQTADPEPPAPRYVAAATAYVQRLARAVALKPAQLPAVRAAAVRYTQALDSLRRVPLLSPSRASAVHTVVEYRFSRVLEQVLSPAQFERYLEFDESPQPAVVAER